MDAIPESVALAVERQLAAYGIRLHGRLWQLNRSEPVPIGLEVDERIVEVAALYMPDVSATAALKAAHSVPLEAPLFVVGPRVHASTADTMRTSGIWFADEAGNAYLRGPGLLVDVRGRKGHVSSASNRHDRSGPANLFTPKRAQVVFALLSEPTLVDASLREIAARSGVSLGMAKDAMDALEHVGFVERLGSRRRLIRTAQLFELWASAYPTGLGRFNRLASVRGDIHSWCAPEHMAVAVSGELAVPTLIRNPESMVIYIDRDGNQQLLRDLMVINRWHSDPHGNILIREMFWRDPHEISERHTASIALVYADLLASHEPRQLEVADEMRRNYDGLVKR